LGASEDSPGLVPANKKKDIQGLNPEEIQYGEYKIKIEKDVRCMHNMSNL